MVRSVGVLFMLVGMAAPLEGSCRGMVYLKKPPSALSVKPSLLHILHVYYYFVHSIENFECKSVVKIMAWLSSEL